MSTDEVVKIFKDGDTVGDIFTCITQEDAQRIIAKLKAAERLADLITKGIRVGMDMEHAENRLIEYRDAGEVEK